MGWSGLDELGALFSPGMRHEQEEKQRRDVLRDDESTGDPVSTVDLDANHAVIRLPPRPDRDPDPAPQ